jgi:predicted negative regulator of RcsB-dependent stress response
MSQPASDSREPSPASTAPKPPQEFDLLAFWILHQRLILRLVIVALLAVAAWGAWLFMDYRRDAGSKEALVAAKTAADYRKVTGDWAGTPAAGTAYIRLAEELRKEGKPADAAQALREFLEKYPVHPLRVNASHALASSLETAGKLDEALAGYQQFASAHANSKFAPLGPIGQARVLLALGKPEDARKALESVEQKFASNPFAEDARTLLDEIKNAAGRKTGGSPRPTPTPAPAPSPAPPAIPLGISPVSPSPVPTVPGGTVPPFPTPATPTPATSVPPKPALPAASTPATPVPPTPATPASPPPATPAAPAPATSATPAPPAPATPAPPTLATPAPPAPATPVPPTPPSPAPPK